MIEDWLLVRLDDVPITFFSLRTSRLTLGESDRAS